MGDIVKTEFGPEPQQVRRRPSERKSSRPTGLLLLTEEDIKPLSVVTDGDDDDVFTNRLTCNVDQNFIRKVNPVLAKDAPKAVTSLEITDALKRLRRVKQTDDVTDTTKQIKQNDDDNMKRNNFEFSNKISVEQQVKKFDNTNPCKQQNTKSMPDEPEVHLKQPTYQTGKTSQFDTKSNTIAKPEQATEELEITPNESFDTQQTPIKPESVDILNDNESILTCKEDPYATIDDVIKNKRLQKPPIPKPKSKSSPAITIPQDILTRSNMHDTVSDPTYTCMTPKVPLPPIPQDDLTDFNIPQAIETSFKRLTFQYEAFLSHIKHSSNLFGTNLKQENFSAGIFTEAGGILKVNGGHLMIPKGALKKPTALFLYRVDNECAIQPGELCVQYQVSPVIIVGPVTTFEECIFLTIDLYVIDGSEWTYEPLSRQSNDTSEWESIKASSISIHQENQWVHTLENLSYVTEFKLTGSPKRKINTDSDGLYDVPIDHFIPIKMYAVIDEVKNELSITAKKVENKNSVSSNEWTDETVLLNQLGGEFLLMKVFGEEEKLHVGGIICGRQTFTKCSYKIPSNGHRNVTIELRQELKESSFLININRIDSDINSLKGAHQFNEDLRIFSTLLSSERFKTMTEYGQCDHWVQFCKLAFAFTDVQSDHFRGLPYCRSLALNLYTAINDTCGNTLEVLTSLQDFLERADILQAATLVKDEILELLSLCDKGTSAEYVEADSESEGDPRDDSDNDHEIDSMHASLRRRTMDRK